VVTPLSGGEKFEEWGASDITYLPTTVVLNLSDQISGNFRLSPQVKQARS
jgi:hypothetical protein